MNPIKALAKAIKDLHGCKTARHIESVPVKETFRGQIAWQGVVEVFSITGHPKAKRCYAWSHLDGDKDERTKVFAVLELPPVTSAQTAVKAAIMSEAKQKSN
jgi:hypothetical protein